MSQERPAESIRVSVVEDDARVRGSFSRLVDQSPGFSCVSQHRSAEDALDELPTVRPDVVLMDINLPGISGVDCVRRLKTLLPEAQVVMLTVYEDTDLIFGALAAGATGYPTKGHCPHANMRCSITSPAATSIRRSRRSSRSATTRFTPTSGAFTRSCRCTHGPRQWRNT
jgi:DNA-binding NarL/FixJ family response regulator